MGKDLNRHFSKEKLFKKGQVKPHRRGCEQQPAVVKRPVESDHLHGADPVSVSRYTFLVHIYSVPASYQEHEVE